jgi:Subtilase family
VQRENLPHLWLRDYGTARFRSPRGGGAERLLPERDREAHSARLLANLDAVMRRLGELDRATERPRGAEGHLITVDALAGAALVAESLADKRTEITLVAETDERAILHVRRDDVEPLRRKVASYGDPEKLTKGGRPRHEPLVAPLEGFRPASLSDLSSGWLTEADVDPDAVYWVELWTRGGRLEDADVRTRVEGEVRWLVDRSGVPHEVIYAFRATERDVYLIGLPGELLLQVPTLVPEVYRIAEPTRGIRDFIVSDREADLVLPDRVVRPDRDATAVVIMDTGIAPEHPLLRPVLRAVGTSVVVGDASPIDTDGHGTEMAGLAAYEDLGGELWRQGVVSPRAWISNVRLIRAGRGDDDDREFWAERTEQGVLAAEAEAARVRVFNMCISAEHPDPGMRTSWSVGLDLLTFNEGLGRLFCVAAGNTDVSPVRADYPNRNLVSFVDDPSQAMNVLTVGAITSRTEIPRDGVHGDLQPIAGEGELSPYSRTGVPGTYPIKPEIVLEGGNCAPDGQLPNAGVDSLSVLTTNNRHAGGRLLTFSWATSAACASLSGLAADVWNANPDLRPETVRALIVHSARWNEALMRQFPDRSDLLRAAGYGEPDVQRAAHSWRTRPTLLMEAELRPAYDEGGRVARDVHLVSLPLPEEALLELGEHEVELSVTLSYFIEPNEANRVNYSGAMLRWDVQRPTEDADVFRQRVNRLERPDGFEATAEAYAWEIGPDRRSRGSVQSDRCTTTAASLAGGKMIAVFPVLGWWEGRRVRIGESMRYGLVVTIDAGDADIDLYAEIEAAIPVEIDV